MSTLDELWAWIYPPLRELTAERASNPDLSWAELRAHFVQGAGLQEPSDAPLVQDVIGQLELLSDDDRNALLDDGDRLDSFVYELAQRHADAGGDQQPQADPAAYDENAWQAYLAENGSYWNGEESSWPQFKEWLLYYATENGFGYPATNLVNLLDGQSAPERVAALAQYGVTIHPSEQIAEPETDESGTEEIRTLLAGDQEFSALPAAQQRQVLTQIRDALGGR
jgi:hypothetical protein